MDISSETKEKIELLNQLLGTPEYTQGEVETLLRSLGLVDSASTAIDVNIVLDSDPTAPGKIGFTSAASTKTTLAHYAAENNMPLIIDYLAQNYSSGSIPPPSNPVNFTQKDAADRTPAWRAAKKENLEVLRSLINAGVDVMGDAEITVLLKTKKLFETVQGYADTKNFEDKLKKTPPLTIHGKPFTDIKEFFKTADADDIKDFLTNSDWLNKRINSRDNEGRTVAHWVAQHGGTRDALLELIKQGVDFTLLDKKDKSAIDLISDPVLREEIRKAYAAKVNTDQLDHVDWTKISVSELKTFVENGANLSHAAYAVRALKAGNTEVAHYLISQPGINLNAHDGTDTLVQLACQQGNEVILMDLVEHSFQKNDRFDWRDGKGRHYMASISSPDLRDKVKKARHATYDLLNPSAAARFGSSPPDWSTITPEQIQDLIDDGARINAKNGYDDVPLSSAIENGNFAAVQKLLERGADVNIPGWDGDTSVHYAAKRIANEVRDADGNPIGKDPTGHSVSFIRMLLQAHPDLNRKNDNGKTPLHLFFEEVSSNSNLKATGPCSKGEILSLVKEFIKAGADFDIEDNGDSTALPPLPPRKPLDWLDESDPELKELKERLTKTIEDEKKKRNNPPPQEEKDEQEEEKGGEEEEGDNPTPNSDKPAEKGEDSSGDGVTDPDKSNPGRVKKLCNALKDATDSFFKNVFEAKHDTAEAFAQDFLFSILAFPLEATNVYLSKVYGEDEKDKLDKLVRRLDAMMQKQGQGPEQPSQDEELTSLSEQTKNLVALGIVLTSRVNSIDPTVLPKLRQQAGDPPSIDSTPDQRQAYFEKMKQAYSADPSIQEAFRKGFEQIAQDPEGNELLHKCFHGYTGQISEKEVFAALTGMPDFSGTSNPVYETIIASYTRIMDETAGQGKLNARIEKLGTFLENLEKEHPEFKTLSAAFSLLQHKESLLNELKDPNKKYIQGEEVQESAVTLLRTGEPKFNTWSDEEIKETAKIAHTLRERLQKGEQDGFTGANFDDKSHSITALMIKKALEADKKH